MDPLLQWLPQATGAGVLAFIVWAFFKGKLYSESAYNEMREDRDAWREVAQSLLPMQEVVKDILELQSSRFSKIEQVLAEIKEMLVNLSKQLAAALKTSMTKLGTVAKRAKR